MTQQNLIKRLKPANKMNSNKTSKVKKIAELNDCNKLK